MKDGGEAPVKGLELGCFPGTPIPAPTRLDLVGSSPGTNCEGYPAYAPTMEPWYPILEGGRGKTEWPGLNGDTGATCPALSPVWESWGSALLSGCGLLEELALLELALALAWLELAICAWSRPDLPWSVSFFTGPLLSPELCSALPDLESV